jgi:hypothetical protein
MDYYLHLMSAIEDCIRQCADLENGTSLVSALRKAYTLCKIQLQEWQIYENQHR